jgi:hypothetical protein
VRRGGLWDGAGVTLRVCLKSLDTREPQGRLVASGGHSRIGSGSSPLTWRDLVRVRGAATLDRIRCCSHNRLLNRESYRERPG